MTQNLIFTALPNGIENGELKLSLFVSPRLTSVAPTPTLRDFDLFSDWPMTIGLASFAVRFFTDTTMAASATATVRSETDASLWSSVLPEWTPVTSHRPEGFTQLPVRSFDAVAMHRMILGIYKAIASDPARATRAPSVRLEDDLGALIDRAGNASASRTLIALDPSREGAILAAMTTEERIAYDFERFFLRYQHDTISPYTDPRIEPFDFHEILALLGDFPFLLRKLGFIVDLTVPYTASIPASGAVQIVPQLPTGTPSTVQVWPKTQYDLRYATRYFRAAARPAQNGFPDSDLRDGMLRLDSPVYEVVQGELDGSASKLVDFCTNMRPFRHECDSNGPETAALPALLAGGFTVLRSGRGLDVATAFQRTQWLNDQLTAGTEVGGALHAEDLLRGYRVDVQRGGPREPWLSLCERTGSVTIDEAHLDLPAGEEGYVKAVTAQRRRIGGARKFEMVVHEAVVGWEGWSLCARRPGRAIVDPADVAHAGSHVADIPSASRASDSFTVGSSIAATPRTLPRLRYGESYRLRARAVDLAGNSLARGEATDAHAAPAQTYLRFEPVASPVLLQRKVVIEGESLEHLVIRSPDEPAQPNDATCDRHVAPPKTNQSTVELHGKLDGFSFADPAGRAQAYALSLREQGTFFDADLPGMRVVGPGNPAPPANRGDALKPGQYVIHEGDTVRIPYLPDPFAAGVSVRADAIGTVTRKFEGGWPDLKSLRIQLVDGGAGTRVVDAGVGQGPLRIGVARGTMLKVQVGSTIRESDLEVMWAWNLLDAATRSAFVGSATAGEHWMLTPSREIVLVNAVKKPIRAPSLGDVTVARAAGATFVDYTRVVMDLHAPSTGHVDVEAEWTELLDNPVSGVKRVAQRGHAFSVSVAYDDPGIFPSTPPHLYRPPVDPDVVCLGSPVPLPSFALRQELGDTKHRIVTLKATGTTRYREYFPSAETRDAATLQREGAEKHDVHIPSSARPDAPRIAYVVPTFEWQQTSPTERRRIGGGLRVYLERPWFSSGEGELLAVIVGAPGATVSEANRQYVSEWGLDPMWAPPANGAVLSPMTAAHVVKGPGIKTESAPQALAEEPSLRIVAVGLPVFWSPERQLWFCDIELDPGFAYFPFVRLAIARYQPHSIAPDPTSGVGFELSRIVRTELAQLTANRAATIGYNLDKTNVRISVVGPSSVNAFGQGTAAAPPPGAGHSVIGQIESRPRGSGDLDWQRANAVSLKALIARDGTTTWFGDLDLPPGFATDATREYRLMITEYETFKADPDSPSATFGAQARLVYADAFPLGF